MTWMSPNCPVVPKTRAGGDKVVGFQDAHGKSHFHRHAPVEKSLLKARHKAIGVDRRCQIGVVEVAVVAEHAVRGQGAVVVGKPLAPRMLCAGTGNSKVVDFCAPQVLSEQLICRSDRPPCRRSCWEHNLEARLDADSSRLASDR